MSSTMVELLNARSSGKFPGLLGLQITCVDKETIESRLDVRPELLAPNGYLHAGTVVGFADTTCGYGVMANLPVGAYAFTTIELKTNFMGTCTEGFITCKGIMVHSGKTTQVWDGEVRDGQSGKVMALFRCTQLLLYKQD